MAARPVDVLDDYVVNMQMLCEVNILLAALSAWIEVWRLANIEALRSATVSEFYRNQMLKKTTMFMVGVGPDLNCYPLGYETALLYDLDGNPVT